MSTFALDVSSSDADIISGLNYALANLGTINTNAAGNVLIANVTTGEITTTSTNSAGYTNSTIVSYLYRYMDVKYANSSTGGSGFTSNCTLSQYYGLRNTANTTISNNPADYIWYQVTGGFGTTKNLWYSSIGGRQISFIPAVSAPTVNYVATQDNTPIDLDVVTAAAGNQVVVVNAYFRSNTQPATPTGGTYNFSNYTLYPPSPWSPSVPTGNDPVYTTQAAFSGQPNSNVAPQTTWSYPTILSSNFAGNTGPQGSRGFIPMAFVLTSSDPTSYTDSQYTTAFSANRSNVATPIGTGYTPITGDTSQFQYANLIAPSSSISVVKTFNANTSPQWQSATGQVISGNVLVTGTVSSSRLNTNDLYVINIQSTNATINDVNSPGYWLQSNTGDARFGGNTSIGNNLTVGQNAVIGSNTQIGGNLQVTGLITQGNLANNVVTTNNITDAAITGVKVALAAISGNNIVANTITGTNIAPNTITANLLAANSVVAGTIAANSITANTIATGAVTAGKIAANAVTAGTVAANAVYANSIVTGSFTANSISGNTIVFGTLYGNSIQANTFQANTINGNAITANSISAISITANSITATQIQTGAITTSKLATDLIIVNDVLSPGATAGSTTGTGYWMQANTGSAYFGGSMTIGNNLKVGTNAQIGANLNVGSGLIVGTNAQIGGNLNVTGLITGGGLNSGTVNTTQIVANAVTSGTIAANAVTSTQIATSAVGTTQLAANSVTQSKSTTGSTIGSGGASITGNAWITILELDPFTPTQSGTALIFATITGNYTLVSSGAGNFTINYRLVNDYTGGTVLSTWNQQTYTFGAAGTTYYQERTVSFVGVPTTVVAGTTYRPVVQIINPGSTGLTSLTWSPSGGSITEILFLR